MHELAQKYFNQGLSGHEVDSLSQDEFTKLLILSNLRAYATHVMFSIGLYLVYSFMGPIGIIAKWVGIVLYGACVLKDIFMVVFGLIMTLGNPFFDKESPVVNTLWRLAQLIITTIDLAFYLILTAIFVLGRINIFSIW